jgi:cysteine-rich repeat protein
MQTHSVSSLATVLLAACFGSDTSVTSSYISGSVVGAIFTTTVDGIIVNENHYPAKTDVYLDGGPSENAPNGAAALAAGDYYFQVTDPSGKVLLSSDAIECRRIRVSADGVIVEAYPGPGGCGHDTGVDADYGTSLGAITVQLFPYDDTPNPGGVYKVWVTPVEFYDDGFVPRYSKTDVFKVSEDAPPLPEPCCGDGILDAGEECDDGNTTSGDGCSATCTLEKEPCCGDGILDAGEECDDGNTTGGDGCSANCTNEYVTD